MRSNSSAGPWRRITISVMIPISRSRSAPWMAARSLSSSTWAIQSRRSVWPTASPPLTVRAPPPVLRCEVEQAGRRGPQDGLSRAVGQRKALHEPDVLGDARDPRARLGRRPGEVLRVVGGEQQPLRPDAGQRAPHGALAALEPGHVEVQAIEALAERAPEGPEPPGFGREPLLDRGDAAAEVGDDDRERVELLEHAPGDEARHRDLQIELAAEDAREIVLPEEGVTAGRHRRVHEDGDVELARLAVQRRKARRVEGKAIHLRGDRDPPQAQVLDRPLHFRETAIL